MLITRKDSDIQITGPHYFVTVPVDVTPTKFRRSGPPLDPPTALTSQCVGSSTVIPHSSGTIAAEESRSVLGIESMYINEFAKGTPQANFSSDSLTADSKHYLAEGSNSIYLTRSP